MEDDIQTYSPTVMFRGTPFSYFTSLNFFCDYFKSYVSLFMYSVRPTVLCRSVRFQWTLPKLFEDKINLQNIGFKFQFSLIFKRLIIQTLERKFNNSL